jgi:hypothetical protein
MASLDEWIEFSYEHAWTDGLPVLPPTPEAVRRLLDGVDLPSDRVVGVVPPRGGVATVEAIAVNAAMAGCLPEYMPVIVAAIEALVDERFNLHGVQCTAHAVQPLVIVSGPAVERLGFNVGPGYFGGGSRANATIGRAVRLVLWNVGGGHTGNPDRSSSAHPGRYTFCIGENLPASPWPQPLHVRRGQGSTSDSAVTVIACEAPRYVSYGARCPAVQNLANIAEAMSTLSHNNAYTQGELLVVFSAGVAAGVKNDGWSEEAVRDYLFRSAGNTVGRLGLSPYFHKVRDSILSQWPDYIDPDDPNCFVPVVRHPSGFVLTTAGGFAGSVICSGWGANGGLSVTRLVRPEVGEDG